MTLGSPALAVLRNILVDAERKDRRAVEGGTWRGLGEADVVRAAEEPGATGLGMLDERVQQLRGEAYGRQAPNEPQFGLLQSCGGHVALTRLRPPSAGLRATLFGSLASPPQASPTILEIERRLCMW
jgi:hypothetical protein